MRSRNLGTVFGAPEIMTTVAANHNIEMQLRKCAFPAQGNSNFAKNNSPNFDPNSGNFGRNFLIFLKEIRQILRVVALRVGNCKPRKNRELDKASG